MQSAQPRPRQSYRPRDPDASPSGWLALGGAAAAVAPPLRHRSHATSYPPGHARGRGKAAAPPHPMTPTTLLVRALLLLLLLENDDDDDGRPGRGDTWRAGAARSPARW
eukprot:scaffold5081_cov430-Prasinococcus_capsulatus_cf.AAC.4